MRFKVPSDNEAFNFSTFTRREIKLKRRIFHRCLKKRILGRCPTDVKEVAFLLELQLNSRLLSMLDRMKHYLLLYSVLDRLKGAIRLKSQRDFHNSSLNG
jgi:hypothetical protein